MPHKNLGVFAAIYVLDNDINVSRMVRKVLGFSGATKERPVLSLSDKRATYAQSIELINMVRQNVVVVISFPPI